MKRYNTFFAIIFLIAVSSCNPTKEIIPKDGQQVSTPPVIIYKTKNIPIDYVAIEMNATGEEVVSYPAPSDIRGRLDKVVPDSLADGYLLDNRGIDQNVAFLALSYVKYASLPRTPAPDELFGFMLSTDPLLEMYRCPLRRSDNALVDTLNHWILSGKLDKCERIR